MKLDYDFIIIGSGLGGLVSGTILSKEGFKVLILERGKKTGGLLHTFKRDQTVFNTGMNYIGSLEEGGFLEQYFRYLGIKEHLSLKRLDINAFEEISFSKDANSYSYAQNPENFIANLQNQFPDNKKEIQDYISQMWAITDRFPLLFLQNYDQINKGDDYLKGGAWDFLQNITQNEKLRSVLGASNSLYGGIKEKTPLYIHALVNRQFINSAWRFVGGSQQLANALQAQIEKAGGEVLNRMEVVKIISDKNRMRVKTADGQVFESKKVISNIHPSQTLQMLEDEQIKPVYRKRIHALENTAGFFNLYLVFKPNSFPYLNRNYYHFADNQVWDLDKKTSKWPGYFMFYTGCDQLEQKFANNATVLTYLNKEELIQWEGSQKSMRGADYESFKEARVQQLLKLLEDKFPGIGACIQSYYAATPLTYQHYIGSPNGSAYGIVKDYKNPYKSIVLPKTKNPNLFFTGQNLNMHGALGVTIGAVLTSAEILGFDYLLKKIKEEIQ